MQRCTIFAFASLCLAACGPGVTILPPNTPSAPPPQESAAMGQNTTSTNAQNTSGTSTLSTSTTSNETTPMIAVNGAVLKTQADNSGGTVLDLPPGDSTVEATAAGVRATFQLADVRTGEQVKLFVKDDATGIAIGIARDPTNAPPPPRADAAECKCDKPAACKGDEEHAKPPKPPKPPKDEHDGEHEHDKEHD